MLPREKHEIERLVQPLLMARPTATSVDAEVAILLSALSDLRAEVQGCRTFTELAAAARWTASGRSSGGSVKGSSTPACCRPCMQTTVAIKNRFHELWEEERTRLQDDTNRVKELERQLQIHPEMVDEQLRQALDLFASAQERFDRGLQEESVRREDALELRQSLNRILERFEAPIASTSTTSTPPVTRTPWRSLPKSPRPRSSASPRPWV